MEATTRGATTVSKDTRPTLELQDSGSVGLASTSLVRQHSFRAAVGLIV